MAQFAKFRTSPQKVFQILCLTMVSHFRANCAKFGPVIKNADADDKSDNINM